jgi:hypothetical protein
MDDEELEKLKKEMEQYGSPLRGAVVQLHEIYSELQRAGFTKKEALHLISKLFVATIIEGPELDK